MDRAYEASAPGRLDVLGGVADYSGSLLLQLALPERTRVRVEPLAGEYVELVSDGADARPVRVPVAWVRAAEPPYDGFRQNVRRLGRGDWPLYVLGCLIQAVRAWAVPAAPMRFSVTSAVPVGAGLSSSAALEVATLRVLAKAYRVAYGDVALATLAQAAENHVVGAPCGLMDQLASQLGDPAHLLAFRCLPAVAFEPAIAVPAGIRLSRHDSGVRHSVGGRAYGRARCAAFMGRAILAAEGELAADVPLAEVDPNRFRQALAAKLPHRISGAEFLARLGATGDPQTSVEPEVRYPVRAAAAHPILEHERARAFASTLRHAAAAGRALTVAEKRRLGGYLNDSHASYSAIGLGHARVDRLVAELLARPGLYGARVTGGGAGGTVVALGEAQATTPPPAPR